MTTGTSSDPYSTPLAVNENGGGVLNASGGTVFETTLTASLAVPPNPIISGSTEIFAETYNGVIPGPTFELTVGDTVFVRLINNLPYPTGIHWHGIELTNSADGTPVTQDGARGAPVQTLGNGVLAGGTYLYNFKVPRPGIFWYHPHHFHSTNRVFRGLYGMIIVTNANEVSLANDVILPSPANTRQLVLSDITVCKTPAPVVAPDLPNDTATYIDPTSVPLADRAEWLSGATAQSGPTPKDLCETNPLKEDGDTGAPVFGAGEVPHIQRKVPTPGTPPTVEGQTVLTNGVNVGGRLGKPDAPGALAPGAHKLSVQRGQGLRLQIVNSAHVRYFRLRLTQTTSGGVTTQVPLVRVGGEGGVLNSAVLEGGNSVGANSFDTKYSSGEILIPPASRVDLVAVMPTDAGDFPDGSVLTLWTRDYQRTGPVTGNWAQIPSVPVMHLEINGDKPGAPYTITGGVDPDGSGLGGVAGTQLLASIPALVENLADSPTTGLLLDPTDAAVFTGLRGTKPGMPVPIELIATGSPTINGIVGEFPSTPYTANLHIMSSRYALHGAHLQLTVKNSTNAHHPFHLHGFSFQPMWLKPNAAAGPLDPPAYAWLYPEFRDVVDIPTGHTLEFRVRLDNRELADERTSGGALGRWLFHCHIFFHAHQGMISELVVTDADGSEKPNVDVGGSWAYAALNVFAERRGTFTHPDGDLMTLTATLVDGTPIGTLTASGTPTPGTTPTAGGTWLWRHVSATPLTEYVYITATDTLGTGVANAAGRKDQTVFRLQIGGVDGGSDNGDPHINTVDGKKYDFQAAGEFIALLDREGMEVQTRQTPVLTSNSYTDSYSGLTISGVSLNTAVAARVGSHRIVYQQGPEQGELQFFVNGKPSQLTSEGMDLDGHRVSGFAANGVMALRVDYLHQTVLTIVPHFWSRHSLWYLNVSVSHTIGNEGLLGNIPEGNWLPNLPNGAAMGPRPKSLADRFNALYRIFANAWRVTDRTSLFHYDRGTSTATFTDLSFPAELPPSILQPGFEVPGEPNPVVIGVDQAKQICQAITEDDLRQDCVFDVATTGDESFAKDYLIAQDLRLKGSAVQIVSDREKTHPGEPLVLTATVFPLSSGKTTGKDSDTRTPRGYVTFLVDDLASGSPVELDERGRARHTLNGLSVGEHKIRAAYTSDDGEGYYHSSSSPNLLLTVEKEVRTSLRSWRILWICIILILIALAAYWYFSD